MTVIVARPPRRRCGPASLALPLLVLLLMAAVGCGPSRVEAYQQFRPAPGAETLAGQYAILLIAPQWSASRDEAGRYVTVRGILAHGEPERTLEVTYNAAAPTPELLAYRVNGETRQAATFPEFLRRELLLRALALSAP